MFNLIVNTASRKKESTNDCNAIFQWSELIEDSKYSKIALKSVSFMNAFYNIFDGNNSLKFKYGETAENLDDYEFVLSPGNYSFEDLKTELEDFFSDNNILVTLVLLENFGKIMFETDDYMQFLVSGMNTMLGLSRSSNSLIFTGSYTTPRSINFKSISGLEIFVSYIKTNSLNTIRPNVLSQSMGIIPLNSSFGEYQTYETKNLIFYDISINNLNFLNIRIQSSLGDELNSNGNFILYEFLLM